MVSGKNFGKPFREVVASGNNIQNLIREVNRKYPGKNQLLQKSKTGFLFFKMLNTDLRKSRKYAMKKSCKLPTRFHLPFTVFKKARSLC